MMDEAEKKLTETIRDACEQVSFEWPSTNEGRHGPPERVIYKDEAAISNAAWHRTELLRLLDKQDSRNAELELALYNALNVLIFIEQHLGECSESEKALLTSTKTELSRLTHDALSDRLARHATLLNKLKNVPEDSVITFLACSREQLEARAMTQCDWIQAYAGCLDGLGLKDALDGARLPADIRRVVRALITDKS